MAKSAFLPRLKADVIHQASLQVLANTGVKLEHPEAIDLLCRAGATRDRDGRILIPPHLVNEALEKARADKSFTMHGRGGKHYNLKNERTYFGPGPDALYTVDLESGKRRRSVLADVTNNVRIADSLPAFEFMMSMALPEDVPAARLYPVTFYEMLRNTTKPIIATSTNLRDLEHIYAICCKAAGGEGPFREKPFIIAYLEMISPLKMDTNSTERLLFCAANNIPMLYAAGANCGSSAPITALGGVVQGSAECLSGLVLARLKNENARMIYGANTSAMDMRSTIVCYGDPTWIRTTAMYADLGRYYGLPSWGTGGSSDSFKINAQAAMEAYEGICTAFMAAPTLVHDVGYLGHGELTDARMLILTDMMIGRARHLYRPVELSEKNLAVRVIDEVARSGELYLQHPHTLESFRDSLWFPPKYINRKHMHAPEDKTLPELLGEEVERILKEHTPEGIPESVHRDITAYLDSIGE
jgi:trimethylamine--corrinoid protein Co-methyltransferase